MAFLKRILKLWLPPIIADLIRSGLAHLRSGDYLKYAPRGWETELPSKGTLGGTDADLIRQLQSDPPLSTEQWLGNSDPQLRMTEHNEYLTFAYVLAMTARQKKTLKVLDYGGSLGHYYWIGRTLVPSIAIEYHCKELPAILREGAELSPEVIWHSDDSCLDQQYDLVVFNASLQYMREWRQILGQAAAAVRTHCYLTRVPTVDAVPSYVAVQRTAGATLLHQQLNRSELLLAIENAGFRVVREFLVGESPPIVNAPEQPTFSGWLLQRRDDHPSILRVPV